MTRTPFIYALIFSLLFGAISSPAFALQEPEKPAPKPEPKQDEAPAKEEKPEEDEDQSDKPEEEEKEIPAFQKMTKDLRKIEGFLDFYIDDEKGKVLLALSPEQLGKEFIYHAQIENGIVAASLFRGQYRGEKIYEFSKQSEMILVTQKNTYFSFDPDNAISKAADANMTDGIAAALKIEATDEESGTILVKAESLLIGETLERIKRPRIPGPPNPFAFNLGKLSKTKSKVDYIKSYPTNALVRSDYVYENPGQLRVTGPEVTDPRNVKIKVTHNFIEMPENDYKARFDDQRVGYFLSANIDQTDLSETPYRDMINRWHLVKKDPTADLSEPVEPIVWWIENTTPQALRPAIKKGVEAWNVAFEAAGFKNAVVVKTQPDDADWDAGDIRYNVLRWTASPTPPFGGYGPSFANPRTGQLLGADIMLEYSFLRYRNRLGTAFTSAFTDGDSQKSSKAPYGLAVPAPEDVDESYLDPYAHLSGQARMMAIAHDHRFCSADQIAAQNTVFGQTMLRVKGLDDVKTKELLDQSTMWLMLHEVGHTLGLNHNMRATQARSYKTVYKKSAQKDGALAGSVMDYPSINFAPKGEKQALYYNAVPGPYDTWAIQFAYDPDLDDPAKRKAHLSRSLEPELAFGNDADDMRSPGFGGIDPRVNIGDMSDDAVAYAIDRLGLVKDSLPDLVDNFAKDGESYEALRVAYLSLTGEMYSQARVISRYIGGVHVDRMVAGQKTPKGQSIDPYRPVDVAKQKQAMAALKDYIFAPGAYLAPAKMLRKMALQRRGYDQYNREAPRLHQRAVLIQGQALQHLLHPITLERISDSGLYGNEYPAFDMMSDLTSALFDADARGPVDTIRQDVQIIYVKSLINMLNIPLYDPVAQSAALSSLRAIRGKADRGRARGDGATRAHRDHLVLLIDKALETYAS